MTLMEMLVVLVVVMSMFIAAVASLTVVGASRLRGASSRMATVIEYVYGRAAINGVRYQLVIDIDEGKYWAECAEEGAPLIAGIAQGTVGEDNSAAVPTRYGDDDDEGDPFLMNLNNTWDDCGDYLFSSRSLRPGIEFDRVLTTHQTDPYEEGIATIGFFPNGFVEPSIIWLREKGEESETVGMTLFIEPMTGSVRIQTGVAEIPRDFGEPEEDR